MYYTVIFTREIYVLILTFLINVVAYYLELLIRFFFDCELPLRKSLVEDVEGRRQQQQQLCEPRCLPEPRDGDMPCDTEYRTLGFRVHHLTHSLSSALDRTSLLPFAVSISRRFNGVKFLSFVRSFLLSFLSFYFFFALVLACTTAIACRLLAR